MYTTLWTVGVNFFSWGRWIFVRLITKLLFCGVKGYIYIIRVHIGIDLRLNCQKGVPSVKFLSKIRLYNFLLLTVCGRPMRRKPRVLALTGVRVWFHHDGCWSVSPTLAGAAQLQVSGNSSSSCLHSDREHWKHPSGYISPCRHPDFTPYLA